MSTRGPVPERSDQRRRRNKPAGGLGIDAVAAVGVVEQPDPDPMWHPLASDWYTSLAESGQARYYEPSDWQTARVWAEVLSRQLSGGRISAQMIAAWSGGATELLTTEGARRRMRMEIDRSEPDTEAEDARVTVLDRYKRDSRAG